MKVIFFCGHESPYGRAHLRPILESDFDILAIVLATETRWAHFRSALSGKPIQEIKQPNYKFQYKRAARHILARFPGNFTLKKRALHSINSKNYLKKKIAESLKKYNVNLKHEYDVNSESFITWLKLQKPDLIISAAFPQIFKKHLLQIPKIGCINSHPSLLPKCRGAHPVFWAIASGEKYSGVTVHYMTELLDDGDIIAQRGFPLSSTIRYNELYDQILLEVSQLVKEVQAFFFNSKRAGIPQENKNATYFRNDREIHRRIFFSTQTALTIDRLVRACDGNASFFYAGKLIQVIQTLPLEKNRNLTNAAIVPEGTVVDLNHEGPCIATKKGFIQMNHILSQGKNLKGINISNQLGWQIGMVIGQ